MNREKRIVTVLYMFLSWVFVSTVAAYDNFIVFGPGDISIVHGPGTDSAFDSPEGIDRLAKTFKERGITGLMHRFDPQDVGDGFMFYNPIGTDNPEHRFLMKAVEIATEGFSLSKTLHAATEKYGLEYWAWWTTVYADGAPSDIPLDEQGLDKTSWCYEHRYVREHPEELTIDRKGKKQYSVREYAYPGARRDKIAEIESLVRKHGIKNIIACMRSEASQIMAPPTDADQYGFNKPVVDEMKRLYGIDIMTDPRFDFRDPNFRRNDPMLDNWRKLRGSYLTQFYRELRQVMNSVDPNIKIGVQLPGGEHIGPPLGNMYVDWRTWINEGLIDLIVYGVTMEATPDPNVPQKGYLTDVSTNKGILPISAFREVIDKSKNPKVRLFQSGGDYYFFTAPDKGFDGWRTDLYTIGFTRGWYQRWSQWKQDIKDFGYIKYIENDFDAMPIKSECYDGGYGDPRYNPKERKGSGIWTWLGNGDSIKPYAQNEIKHGAAGNAMKLTSGNDAMRILKARHWCGTDRGMYTWSVQNAIANGTARLSFRLYRPDANSGVSVWIESDKTYIHPVNVNVAAGGAISYSVDGNTISSGRSAKINQWQQFVINVDLETKKYSISLDGTQIAENIAYPSKADSFCVIYFDPGNMPNAGIYLDDVSLHWKPQLYAVSGKETVVFSDDCEPYASKSKLTANSKNKWKVTPAGGSDTFVVENSMSFGDGVRCIKALGGGSMLSKPFVLKSNATVVVDFDVFLKSNLQGIYLVPPTQGWESKNGTVIRLVNDKNDAVIDINAVPSGGWSVWDGKRYADCGSKVQYDVWNHLRIIIDGTVNEWSLVVQPMGELPKRIYHTALDAKKFFCDNCRLKISPSENSGHISCYDNVQVSVYRK